MSDTADLDKVFEQRKQKKQQQQQQQQKQKQSQKTTQQKSDQTKQQKDQSAEQQQKQQQDYDDQEQEELHGDIQIGGVKVQDIKDVKKRQEQDKMLKKETDFTWDNMVGSKQQQSKAQQAKEGAGQTTQDQKNKNINFRGKGKPTFTKSQHVGNKQEFPELGGEMKAAQDEEKKPANVGGPLGSFNQQYNTQKKDEQKEEEPKKEAQRPRFTGTGFKKLLEQQNQDNAEANKDIDKLQEKLKQEIQVHEKVVPRNKDEERPFNQKKKYSGQHKKEGEDEKKDDDDDEFDKVVDQTRHHGRGAFRGGRGGRGRGDFDPEHRRGGGGQGRGDFDPEQRRGAGQGRGDFNREEGGGFNREEKKQTYNKPEKKVEKKEAKVETKPKPAVIEYHPDADLKENADWKGFSF